MLEDFISLDVSSSLSSSLSLISSILFFCRFTTSFHSVSCRRYFSFSSSYFLSSINFTFPPSSSSSFQGSGTFSCFSSIGVNDA
ncbi:hypothetical protein AR158_c738R [Paramecium bursaria Chlorella virus AR158]|uniref:hypothetical protein n=1 Tax=Paramecium bursaria Chlorella virus AR158 TaxID=380598 RepID=UPI00015AA89A|nr:hypothetical protein AR158_c738R [Paramecium bursaria Chlorella virus AR158]ABU44283.1 hypothetical protein AR158_c738R [Paramecium bursaria Chlorella virus AR158]